MTENETHTETGIPAEVHTDDERRKLKFDALPWFEQASDQELRELAACGFGGDYPADQVAYFFETGRHQLPAVAELFDYLAVVNRALPEGTDMIGFECHVDAEAAGEWLHRHRPHLL